MSLERIIPAATARGLRFVVIGGLAVVAHGYGRTTKDVDLMISRIDKERWLELMAASGFKAFHDGGSFVQFAAADDGADRIDIMHVASESFEQIWEKSLSTALGGDEFRVPMLNHLLALKVHSLKHGANHRQFIDRNDILQLIRINSVDVGSPEIRAIFAKHGTEELYQQVVKVSR